MFSCGPSYLFIIDLNNLQNINIVKGNFEFINLYFDKMNRNIYLNNKMGNIYLFNESSFNNKILSNYQNTIKKFNFDGNYIFNPTNKGIEIYKKVNSNIILNKELIYILENITVIEYNKEDNELIIGDQNGYIRIWNLESSGPKIIWKAHEKEITQIYYDNEYKNSIIFRAFN